MFGFFAIQLDKTTDVANLAELCVYVRYIHEWHLEDEFSFCSFLTTRTTAKEIFNFVNKFFDEHNLKWKHVIRVCTDGAPVMLGCRSGFRTLVKEKSPGVAGTHCTIHHQVLMSKALPDQLKNVLDDVVKAVNFIKANAFNSRLFAELCKESDYKFVTLLLHSHVRWLSKGKVLKRVFILRHEMKDFFKGNQSQPMREKILNLFSHWLTLSANENSTFFLYKLVRFQFCFILTISPEECQMKSFGKKNLLLQAIFKFCTTKCLLKPELYQKFSDDYFLMCLPFLVDIFESVNFFNLALQGKETNLIHCREKLSAFNMKLTLWHSKSQNKNFAPFPHLNAFLDENELDVNEGVLEVMKRHISILGEEIQHYFPDLQDFQKYCRFVNNPFGTSVGHQPSQDNLLQE